MNPLLIFATPLKIASKLLLLSSLVFLSVSLLATQSASAREGHEGNGGDAILCVNGSTRFVRLYDFYEAKAMRGIELELGGPRLSYEQKIAYALNRLAKVDLARAVTYRAYWKTFLIDTKFTDDDLIDIPDSSTGHFPAGCQIKQAAVQGEVELPGDALYTIDRKLWNLMDADNKAGLVLHELVLRGARSTRDEFSGNTKLVRYYNSLLTSKAFASIGVYDYLKVLKESGVYATSVNISGFAVRPMFDHYRNRVTDGYLLVAASIQARLPSGDSQTFHLPTGASVYFDENLALKSAGYYGNLAAGTLIRDRGLEIKVTDCPREVKRNNPQFVKSHNGILRLSSINLCGTFSSTQFPNQTFAVDKVVFSDSGLIDLVAITGNPFRHISGLNELTLRFSETGHVSRFDTFIPDGTLTRCLTRSKCDPTQISAATFDEHLEITSFQLSENFLRYTSLEADVQHKSISITSGGLASYSMAVRLHPGFKLKTAYLRQESVKLKRADGKQAKIVSGQRFDLDQSGLVLCVATECPSLLKPAP